MITRLRIFFVSLHFKKRIVRILEIITLENISKVTSDCVITIGMYDGVHIGHQQMLKELKQTAEDMNAMSVVITFSSHPRSVLDKAGDNPIQLLQTTTERYNKIAEYGIDLLIPIHFTKEFASLSPKQFLDTLLDRFKIKVLLLGYDNRFGNPNNHEYEELIQSGHYGTIQIQKDLSGVYFNDIEVSSTQIRKAIAKGDMSTATAMLGNCYSLSGIVEKGLQNGTKIGFPTANITPNNEKIIPKCGVYATKTLIGNTKYNSVTNIGNNPTFNGQKLTIETHIMDFNGNIYGKEITIEFVKFIREESKFTSVDSLRTQMSIDMTNAKNILA